MTWWHYILYAVLVFYGVLRNISVAVAIVMVDIRRPNLGDRLPHQLFMVFGPHHLGRWTPGQWVEYAERNHG